VLLDWKTSTHTLLVPVQWSAASLSHAPPCELPVQLVTEKANPSAGHVSLKPEQVSATSHWPAEARHVVPPVLNWQADVQHEMVVPFTPKP
jgi:hypothetical protein